VDFVRVSDVVAEVRDRCARLDSYKEARQRAQPRWRTLESVMRDAMGRFATRVTAYASGLSV
jgi:hypothetical protein